MGGYIFLGILVSLIMIVLIWVTGDKKDDLAKWLLTLALAASGWAFYPLYVIGGIAYFVRKQSLKANAEADHLRAVKEAKAELAEEARQLTERKAEELKREIQYPTHRERDTG